MHFISLLLVLISKGSKKHMPCMGSFVYSKLSMHGICFL